MWNPGEAIVWRGIYRNRIWHAIPATVVKDSPEEVILSILPGVDGFTPEGYSQGKQNGKRRWDFIDKSWKLERHIWQTNRLLLLHEPSKYYAIIYFWHHDSGRFMNYYVNFQLPFCRSHCGIDSLDMELDLIINADFSYHWKDLDEYQKGIASGMILPECVEEIEHARQEVLNRLSKRQYPFDGSWLDWKPDPQWPIATLPANWDKIHD